MTSMLCQSCMKVLRSKDFPAEEQLAWNNLKDGPFMCHTCAGTKIHRSDIKIYDCHGTCNRRWPEGAFDPDALRTWERNHETGAMKCIRCTAQAAQDKRLQLTHQCSQCEETKQLHEYAPIILKILLLDKSRGHGSAQKACEACQYPACGRCTTTPDFPVTNTGTYHVGEYFCHTCTYPPSS